MTSDVKHDTGTGLGPPREASGHDRSAPARKAAATRRKKQADRDAEFRRRIFLVANGTDPVKSYGPVAEMLYGLADADEPTRHFTLDDVIADLVRRINLPAHDPTASEDDQVGFGGDEDGFGGEDLAVWRGGKLLAVIRGGDGRPEVIRFDGPEGDTTGRSDSR